MGGLIIDTCVFIDAEKQDIPLDFKSLAINGNIYMSAITVSELLVGVHHANSEIRRLKRSAHIEGLIAVINILDFDIKVARVHAEISASLAKKHTFIGAHDLLIAATALTHGCAVLTYNEKEFSRVPRLTVLTP